MFPAVGCLVAYGVALALIETLNRRTEARARRVARRRSAEVQDVLCALLPLRHDGSLSFLPDVFCALYLAALVVAAVANDRLLDMWASFLGVHAVLLAMRAASQGATVTGLASPNAAAKGKHSTGSSEIGMGGVALNSGIHDLMFSGHTSTGTLCMVYASGACGFSPLSLGLCSAAAVANSALQVVVGDHYTQDVLIANFITVPVALLAIGEIAWS